MHPDDDYDLYYDVSKINIIGKLDYHLSYDEEKMTALQKRVEEIQAATAASVESLKPLAKAMAGVAKAAETPEQKIARLEETLENTRDQVKEWQEYSDELAKELDLAHANAKRLQDAVGGRMVASSGTTAGGALPNTTKIWDPMSTPPVTTGKTWSTTVTYADVDADLTRRLLGREVTLSIDPAKLPKPKDTEE